MAPRSDAGRGPDGCLVESAAVLGVLGAAGIDVCVVDVPMVLGPPRPLNGTYIAGWGTHDLICKGSWPTGLWHDLERQFGSPRMPREYFGQQTSSSLSRLTQQLLGTTDQLRDISIELLETTPGNSPVSFWVLFIGPGTICGICLRLKVGKKKIKTLQRCDRR